jgi:hypothetical protein
MKRLLQHFNADRCSAQVSDRAFINPNHPTAGACTQTMNSRRQRSALFYALEPDITNYWQLKPTSGKRLHEFRQQQRRENEAILFQPTALSFVFFPVACGDCQDTVLTILFACHHRGHCRLFFRSAVERDRKRMSFEKPSLSQETARLPHEPNDICVSIARSRSTLSVFGAEPDCVDVHARGASDAIFAEADEIHT